MQNLTLLKGEMPREVADSFAGSPSSVALPSSGICPSLGFPIPKGPIMLPVRAKLVIRCSLRLLQAPRSLEMQSQALLRGTGVVFFRHPPVIFRFWVGVRGWRGVVASSSSSN